MSARVFQLTPPSSCLWPVKSAASLGYLWRRFFHQRQPRFSCWSEESRYTARADTAIFQVAEGDGCALTLRYTHTHAHASRHLRTCLSAHTHTHRQTEEGWGGKVAGYGNRVRWGHRLCDKGTGTRCLWCLSWVVMLVVGGACVCVWLWRTPTGVAECHQLPVNNVVKISRRKSK